MAQDDIIARRYAKGLAERAVETDAVERVRKDLAALAAVMDARAGASYVPELAGFLASPKIAPADKQAAAENIASKMGVDTTVADFFKLLIRNGRADLLPRINRAFGDMSCGLTGEYTAVVETARPLTADQESRLASVLSTALGGAVLLHQQIEPGLLAGARVKIGDRTFDGSVLGKLNRLRERLIVAGPKELRERMKEAAE